jgi:hypothetical protein
MEASGERSVGDVPPNAAVLLTSTTAGMKFTLPLLNCYRSEMRLTGEPGFGIIVSLRKSGLVDAGPVETQE